MERVGAKDQIGMRRAGGAKATAASFSKEGK
jgi:hypothetical protein